MPDYSRPIIGISKCLEFDMCRYDGSRINNNFVRIMKKYVDFVPVCPEVDAGMGVPRETVALYGTLENQKMPIYRTDSGITFEYVHIGRSEVVIKTT